MLALVPQSWILGLIGGLMIGLAAASFLLVNGRVLGASGILGGLVDGSGSDNAGERTAFLAGLVGAPALAAAVTGAPATHLGGNLPLVIGAGLLVGVGTRMANGCTSGHGVVGIPRFSLRSIVATLVYLAAGGLAFYLARHILGIL